MRGILVLILLANGGEEIVMASSSEELDTVISCMMARPEVAGVEWEIL